MNVLEWSEQEIIRRNSLEQLKAMGINPYPAAEYVVNAYSDEIVKRLLNLFVETGKAKILNEDED
jgi:lysyl-tRNA synthetase class 2